MIWSLELVKAGARIYRDQSLPMTERLAGLDYGNAAKIEATERARKLADKLWPLGPKAHGFYQPADFMKRAYQHGQNRRVFNRAFERLLGIIIKRDGLLPEGGAA